MQENQLQISNNPSPRIKAFVEGWVEVLMKAGDRNRLGGKVLKHI